VSEGAILSGFTWSEKRRAGHMGVKEFAAGGLLEAGGLPWAGVEG
jgi:hypothetical protein